MFGKDEAYFNPRTHLFPFEHLAAIPGSDSDDEKLATFVFPWRKEWILQHQDPLIGDSSDAASNFLFQLLPFLARVVVQDGIYWIHDFPNHYVSVLLQNMMPPWYPTWAQQAHQEVQQQLTGNNATGLQTLNGAVQQAFQFVHNQNNMVVQHQQQLLINQQQQFAAIHTCLNQIMQNQKALQSQMQHLVQNQQPCVVPPLPQAMQVQVQPPQQQHMIATTLCNVPLQPAIDHLPKSFASLLVQWHAQNMGKFQKAWKTDWKRPVCNLFSKYNYLYEAIEKVATTVRSVQSLEERENRAVEILDVRQGTKSMDTYMKEIKAADSSVKKGGSE